MEFFTVCTTTGVIMVIEFVEDGSFPCAVEDNGDV